MRISAKVWNPTVPLLAAILLLPGLSSAQEPAAQVSFGPSIPGLQMRLFVERMETAQPPIPRFRVELRNVGDTGLLLDLGSMTPDGARQYPTAVSLILSDGQGETQRLELRAPSQVNGAAKKTFLLPLPAGARFSFLVDLRNYWTIASQQFDSSLRPGTYSLLAQFNAFSEANVGEPLSAEGYVLSSRMFDIVYPQPNGVPTSNKVQFEVGDR
jgi:hypothetical protein